MRARTRTALVVAPVVGVGAAALVRLLRGAPSPAFTTPPTVPRLAPEREASAAKTATTPAETPTGPADQRPAGEPPGPDGPARAGDGEPAAAPAAAAARRAWVEPVDGACPEGYEIKVKIRSGIYHRPGMLAYDRTIPDRCYATPEAAESDGYRAAKR